MDTVRKPTRCRPSFDAPNARITILGSSLALDKHAHRLVHPSQMIPKVEIAVPMLDHSCTAERSWKTHRYKRIVIFVIEFLLLH